MQAFPEVVMYPQLSNSHTLIQLKLEVTVVLEYFEYKHKFY